jgi:hypothetical protein
MKKFIAFCIFMIGMMIMWPPGEQAKASTNTDQVCIVVDIGHADYIAIDQVTTQYVPFELAAIKPPGVITAENVVQKSPDFGKFYSLNYRTCLNTKDVSNQRKFITKNKVSPGQIRIRDDTSV